jgi:hypothetical protein
MMSKRDVTGARAPVSVVKIRSTDRDSTKPTIGGAMVSVYKIWADDGYQELGVVDENAFSRESERSWKFQGEPAEDKFVPLEVYVRRTSLKKPDIWEVFRTFGFEKNALGILSLPLEKAGELFDIPLEKRKLTILNCTYVIDCLDLEKAKFDPATPWIIDEFAFHANRLDYSLFKIPQNTKILFAVEGLASPDDEFKPLVEKHKLTGIRFEKLWSDE